MAEQGGLLIPGHRQQGHARDLPPMAGAGAELG